MIDEPPDGEKYPMSSGANDKIEEERLVRDNIQWMLSLAERLLNDHGLAQDAVQEAFINALRNLDTFEDGNSGDSLLNSENSEKFRISPYPIQATPTQGR